VWDVESEQEEHSLSLSQHSSPSQSDQEQTPAQKANVSIMDSQRYHWFKQVNKSPSYCQLDNDSSNTTVMKNITQRSVRPMKHQPKQEQYVHIDDGRKVPRHTQHLVGPFTFKFWNTTLLKYVLFLLNRSFTLATAS